MRKILSILLIVIICQNIYSQEDDFKTILGSTSSITGFGGPFMSFSGISGEIGHMMGGGGGVLLDDFFFGGYGISLTNSIEAKDLALYTDLELDFGYGGFWTGYVLMRNRAIHPSFSGLIGWGEVTLHDAWDDEAFRDNVFVFTPVVELELNFTQYFKLGIGGSYRIVSGIGLDGYKNSDFSGPGIFMFFKFGWF